MMQPKPLARVEGVPDFKRTAPRRSARARADTTFAVKPGIPRVSSLASVSSSSARPAKTFNWAQGSAVWTESSTASVHVTPFAPAREACIFPSLPTLRNWPQSSSRSRSPRTPSSRRSSRNRKLSRQKEGSAGSNGSGRVQWPWRGPLSSADSSEFLDSDTVSKSIRSVTGGAEVHSARARLNNADVESPWGLSHTNSAQLATMERWLNTLLRIPWLSTKARISNELKRASTTENSKPLSVGARATINELRRKLDQLGMLDRHPTPSPRAQHADTPPEDELRVLQSLLLGSLQLRDDFHLDTNEIAKVYRILYVLVFSFEEAMANLLPGAGHQIKPRTPSTAAPSTDANHQWIRRTLWSAYATLLDELLMKNFKSPGDKQERSDDAALREGDQLQRELRLVREEEAAARKSIEELNRQLAKLHKTNTKQKMAAASSYKRKVKGKHEEIESILTASGSLISSIKTQRLALDKRAERDMQKHSLKNVLGAMQTEDITTSTWTTLV